MSGCFHGYIGGGAGVQGAYRGFNMVSCRTDSALVMI